MLILLVQFAAVVTAANGYGWSTSHFPAKNVRYLNNPGKQYLSLSSNFKKEQYNNNKNGANGEEYRRYNGGGSQTSERMKMEGQMQNDFFYLGDRSEISSRSVPSEENCPIRNEFKVKAKGLNCVRKCTMDTDCQNDRKLCLCDGLCGLSCIRPEKECPELPDPPNGQVHLFGRHFQDEAVYSCNEGYQLVGIEKSSCQASGRWSGSQPSCKEYNPLNPSPFYCSAPPRIENASHNGSEDQSYWELDTQLTYQCYPGFKREGFDHAKCFYINGTATWFGPDLACRPIECGPPEDILNGVRSGNCLHFRCQITYDCLPGYKLEGVPTRICQADGTWTQAQLPTCEAVQCSLPTHPSNGKVVFTTVSYRSRISYECNYGYMVVGNHTRTCEANKMWSGYEPECEEINCGPPGGGILPNGWLEGSRTSMHAVVVFNCLDGMVLEGAKSATCNSEGKWSNPNPKCLAPCIIPEVEHGNSSLRFGSKVEHGGNLTIHCEENYETLSDSEPIKCYNGTWSMRPKCFPQRCKTVPPPPKNGMVVVSKVSHGAVGLYQCKDGFRLINGINITTCNYGTWTGHPPECKEVYCPFPGYIQNGKVLLIGNMGLYDYRPYVKRISNDRQIMFDCDREYKLERRGPKGATCVDGKWSPDTLPECMPENHPSIRWLDKREVSQKDLAEFLKEQSQKKGSKFSEQHATSPAKITRRVKREIKRLDNRRRGRGWRMRKRMRRGGDDDDDGAAGKSLDFGKNK